jgi:hypothetical protein
MLCVCTNELKKASNLLSALNAALPSVSVNLDLLPRLNLALALALDLDVLPRLPNLIAQLPTMTIATGAPAASALAVPALALVQFRAAFGINLLDLKAQPQLDLLAKMNTEALNALPPANTSLLSLQMALSAILTARVALNLNLLDDINAMEKLEAKLAPLATLPPALTLGSAPVALALNKLINLARVVQAARLQFGIDLNSPQGPSRLGAALATMANLRLPALAIQWPKLNLALAALQLNATMKAALGVQLTDPAARSAIASSLALLSSLRLPRLQLPTLALSLPALKLALGLPPLALKLDLSPLNTTLGSMPNFTGLSVVASLALALRLNFGINLIAKVPCGAICPFG